MIMQTSTEIQSALVSNPTQEAYPGYSLSEWLNVWLDTYKACKVKAPTIEIYKYIIGLICQFDVKNKYIRDVTEMDLQNILNKLCAENYSKSSISKAKFTLQQSMKPALRQQLIESDPSIYLELPDAPTKTIEPLTQAQQMNVENCCADLELGHIVVFLLRTGLRRAELMGLKWADYDKRKKEIYIRKSKTAAGVRTVPLLSDARKIIEAQPKINEFIFNNTKLRPIKSISLRRLYERIRRETNIWSMTNHVCRHTFVTRLCEKGVSAKAIAQIIGHAKVDYVLDIYAKLEKAELRKAIYSLERQQPSKKSGSMDLLLTIPNELYQQLIRTAFDRGLPVDDYIIQEMKLSYINQDELLPDFSA